MKAKVGHAGGGARGFEWSVVVVAGARCGAEKYVVVIRPADLAVLLHRSEGLAVDPHHPRLRVLGLAQKDS
jgi:hypothetical protein